MHVENEESGQCDDCGYTGSCYMLSALTMKFVGFAVVGRVCLCMDCLKRLHHDLTWVIEDEADYFEKN